MKPDVICKKTYCRTGMIDVGPWIPLDGKKCYLIKWFNGVAGVYWESDLILTKNIKRKKL